MGAGGQGRGGALPGSNVGRTGTSLSEGSGTQTRRLGRSDRRDLSLAAPQAGGQRPRTHRARVSWGLSPRLGLGGGRLLPGPHVDFPLCASVSSSPLPAGTPGGPARDPPSWPRSDLDREARLQTQSHRRPRGSGLQRHLRGCSPSLPWQMGPAPPPGSPPSSRKPSGAPLEPSAPRALGSPLGTRVVGVPAQAHGTPSRLGGLPPTQLACLPASRPKRLAPSETDRWEGHAWFKGQRARPHGQPPRAVQWGAGATPSCWGPCGVAGLHRWHWHTDSGRHRDLLTATGWLDRDQASGPVFCLRGQGYPMGPGPGAPGDPCLTLLSPSPQGTSLDPHGGRLHPRDRSLGSWRCQGLGVSWTSPKSQLRPTSAQACPHFPAGGCNASFTLLPRCSPQRPQ